MKLKSPSSICKMTAAMIKRMPKLLNIVRQLIGVYNSSLAVHSYTLNLVYLVRFSVNLLHSAISKKNFLHISIDFLLIQFNYFFCSISKINFQSLRGEGEMKY